MVAPVDSSLPPAEKGSTSQEATRAAECGTPSLVGRFGAMAMRFDNLIAERFPDAIARLCRYAAHSVSRNLHAGRWHNYAFYVVIAVVLVAVIAVGTRGCTPGGGL